MFGLNQLYVYLLAALLGFGAGWQIQSWRIDAKELGYAEQELSDERSAAAAALRRADNVIAAQNEAAVRLYGLRAAAVATRGELDRLRTQSAETLRAAGASLDACIIGATAFSQLLSVCGEDFARLAATADRHVSDIKTITQAWPK